MTLTVRLGSALESALQRHCEALGVTKSHVVQESLAAYLLTAAPTGAAGSSGQPTMPDSINYRAFAAAGLVGVIAEGSGAGKAQVRARVAARARASERTPSR